jgi:hypothetical protein
MKPKALQELREYLLKECMSESLGLMVFLNSTSPLRRKGEEDPRELLLPFLL